MRILFFGDIVGKVGRDAVHLSLPKLVKKYGVDFVIANGENASHGKGLTESNYHFLVESGVDCVTLGNHFHSKPQIDYYIDDADNLVRPINLKNYALGEGSAVFTVNGLDVRVTNVMGQAFMDQEVEDPIKMMEDLLDEIRPCIHIVDFHADSTSEKAIFGHFFDGRVTAVLGTHTHVATNDCRILEGGTAFQSDVGMCGDPDGVIGFEKESVINRIVYGEGRFELNDKARMMINAVLIDVDELTYKATAITPIVSIVEK
jgi:metallophosphoesterase (TIGR00282 family)